MKLAGIFGVQPADGSKLITCFYAKCCTFTNKIFNFYHADQ